jgi:hypothetical protein
MIFETSWEQSRELREAGESGASEDKDVLGLFRVARGDGVGFSASLVNNELGPFTDYLSSFFEHLRHRRSPKDSSALPLFVFPAQADARKDSMQGHLYFSLSSPFSPARKSKQAQAMNTFSHAVVAIRNRGTAYDLRELNFKFLAHNAALGAGPHAVKFKDYLDKDFEKDFAEQLLLARNAEWGRVSGEDDDVYRTSFLKRAHPENSRQHGFLASFVRISRVADTAAVRQQCVRGSR